MRDQNASNSRRDDMAKSAAPYLHAKIATTPFWPGQEQPDKSKKLERFDLWRRIIPNKTLCYRFAR
jgi:hypothetical protein